MRCADCQRQTSAIAGTVFEGPRKPLRVWFQAMWFVTGEKLGGSALGLQRVLGHGSYQTAWAWLHKLRRAMVRPGRDRLRGRVEVDETYVGGVEARVHGWETETKAMVIIAAEDAGKGARRIRMACIPDVTGESLLPFIREAIESGSDVHTDGWRGYTGVADAGYRQVVTPIKRSGQLAHELLPRVHRVASLLKRWLLGTHQGAVSREHLAYYLDEFTFRYNRRASRSRGMLFYRLLQNAVQTPPAPYRTLVRSVQERRNHK
jgi:transposase-like protein